MHIPGRASEARPQHRLLSCRTAVRLQRLETASKTQRLFASAGRSTPSGATPSAGHGKISAVACEPKCWPNPAPASGLGRRDDAIAERSLRRPVSPADGSMHGRRGLRLLDEAASAQRQFDDDRAHALCRPYRPCASDDAGASRRTILVSRTRPAHFAQRPGLAPFVPRSLPGGPAFVDQGDHRPAAARRITRAPVLRGAARQGPHDIRRTSAHRQLGQAELRPLPARHRPAPSSRGEHGGPHADLELKALAARADRAARRPSRPYSRASAAAGVSRTCDRQQPAQRDQQPERASAA